MLSDYKNKKRVFNVGGGRYGGKSYYSKSKRAHGTSSSRHRRIITKNKRVEEEQRVTTMEMRGLEGMISKDILSRIS